MNGGQHFDDGETITFTINVGNLDSAYSYQLEWRLCEYSENNDGNWVDGYCNVMSPDFLYDDMMNGVFYHGEEDYAFIGGELNNVNSGATNANTIAQIDLFQDALDPNGNSIPMSNGQNLKAKYLFNGHEYSIGAILSISGVTVADSVSNGFAYGHAGDADIDLDRAGNCLLYTSDAADDP